MKNEEMNGLLRKAAGRTIEEIEEGEGDGTTVDMNALLREAFGYPTIDTQSTE